MSDRKHSQTESHGTHQFLVPILFTLLVGAPVLYYGWNSERARWTAAQGKIEYSQGKIEDGIALLEKAVERAPHDIDLQLLLAEKLMMHGRADEALQIIDTVIPVSTNVEPALRMKANCLLYLSRESEALKTLKNVSDYLTPDAFDEPLRLNELAYFRALAGEELDAAKEDIQQAISIFQVQMWWLDQFPMTLADQTVVASAMVSRLLDRRELVIRLLDSRIEHNDDQLYGLEQDASEYVYLAMGREFPISSELENEIKEIQQTKHSVKQNLATLLTVRALLYQDSDELEKSNLDRQKVRLIDFDSEKLVDQIPDDWTLLNLMYSGAMFLDTRAMVSNAKIPGNSEALRDLNIAVTALELLSMTDRGPIQNTIRDDRGTRFQTIELKRAEATIRMHRAKVLMRRGQTEKAEDDYLRIEELGFDRDEVLF